MHAGLPQSDQIPKAGTGQIQFPLLLSQNKIHVTVLKEVPL